MRKLMITALIIGIAGTVYAEEMLMPINAHDLSRNGPSASAYAVPCTMIPKRLEA
jgi:hypothetical protein